MRLTGIGECMVELSHEAGDRYTQGFAGDVFNTCYYYAALLKTNRLKTNGFTTKSPETNPVKAKFFKTTLLETNSSETNSSEKNSSEANTLERGGATFVSALGDDALSDALLDFCRQSSVRAQCTREAGATLGLYLIRRDALGERTFSYWRNAAPARRMIAKLSVAQRERIESAELLLLSGITLAILDDAQRETLRQLVIDQRKRGGLLAFDPNYRPALWESVDAARRWIDAFYALSDIAFPGLEDERALFGVATSLDVLRREPIARIVEVVVKAGDRCIRGRACGAVFQVPCAPAPAVVDTTAAGDAFNAAYLVARVHRLSPNVCAAYAARVAAVVIGRRGAIVADSLLPKLDTRANAE